MNILLSSYSVNPYRGSEDGIGWNWTVTLSRAFPNDKIYLLTKRFNEADTKKGIAEQDLKNVELVIVDVPDALNWFREKHSAFHHMYYALWQKVAYNWAKRSGIHFDIIHHVTMNDFRFTGRMYKFKNSKTIFGPVGGGQSTAPSLKCYEKHRSIELFRELVNKTRASSPFYRHRIRQFDRVYAINGETAKIIEKSVGTRCERLMELAVADEFRNLGIIKMPNDVCKIVFVGRLIEKKGLGLLLDAVRKLGEKLPYTLEIYGDGGMKAVLEEYIDTNSIQKRVRLMGAVEHSEISSVYEKADIFVMPSLRETSGNVLIEALAHKVPVVALDMSIAHDLSEKGCGLFVNPYQEKDKVVSDFANALEELIASPEKRIELGENGYHFVNNELSWENKFTTVYGDILKKRILVVNPILYTNETREIKQVSSIKDTMIYNLCLGFLKENCNVTLAACSSYKPTEDEDYPFDIVWLDAKCQSLCPVNSLPFCPDVKKLAKNGKYDLIISSEVFSLNSLMLTRSAGKRLVIWHELAKHNRIFRGVASRVWYGVIARLFFSRTPIIPRSVEAKEFISKYCKNVSDTIIDHGVDIEKFTPVTDKDNCFAVCSQLIARKRIDKILYAFGNYLKKYDAGAKLYIMGEGEEEQALKALSQSLGVGDSVVFTGKLAHSELIGILQRAKAMLVYTEKDNNMVSVVESIAVATPVITTSVPYNASYIRANGLGIVSDSWNEDDMKEIADNSVYINNCLAYRDTLSANAKARQFIKITE